MLLTALGISAGCDTKNPNLLSSTNFKDDKLDAMTGEPYTKLRISFPEENPIYSIFGPVFR
jgi:hypothetical protein